jgi:hypothetical protein
MSEPLIKELEKLYEVTTGEAPDDAAGLNYHIPWHSLVGYEKKGKHAISYTHCNVGNEAALMDACERADLITCMTFRGRDELIELGVDPSKLWVIYSAADQYFFRKRVIGIVGYPQPNGRKRESLILDLAWSYDLTPYQFLFIGAGWDDMVTQLQGLGVSAATYHAETDELLRNMYHKMDLLLVTGYREGGPLPLIEAMASGCDVLSPRFGYAADLLEESQLYDDMADLAEKLDALTAPYIRNHKLARACTWMDYCAEHAFIFGRLMGESVDLYPERGMSRYAQVMDVIDQMKPFGIVEVGTWSGARAIQMIQTAAKHRPAGEIEYQGFDLFEQQTAEQFRRELSKIGWDEDIVSKRINATGANVELITGDTKETLGKNINDFESIVYFVDGGHSEETIRSDGENVLEVMQNNSVAVFDDYYHEGKPEGMGCNDFIDNLDLDTFEVVHLPARTITADGRNIGMVKVRRNANIYLQRREALAGSNTFHDRESADCLSSVRIENAPTPANI